jgi:hypothetical protein
MQSLFRYIHELLGFHIASSDRDRPGVVADKSIVYDPDIQADDVSELEPASVGQSMHDFFVNGNAEVARVTAIAEESDPGPKMADAGGAIIVQLASGQPRPNPGGDLIQDLACNRTGLSHEH